MNELQVFDNDDFGTVRGTLIAGEPYFVGKDVASALGYVKTSNALISHVDEDDTLKQGVADSLGRVQETTLINESGLYSLIFTSKLPTAKKFKRWVTSEVLPAIRKTGFYRAIPSNNTQPCFAVSEWLRATQILADCPKERLKMISGMLQKAGFPIEIEYGGGYITSKIDKSQFSERLNTVMREKDIGCSELAERTGLARKTCYTYKNGANAPKQSNIEKLANALGVSVEYLLCADDEAEEPEEI